MRVEIDQSGKIETTNRHTALGLSNRSGTLTRSILIHAREKRKLQRTFRAAGKPTMFVYKTFAAGIVLLLNELDTASMIVIDTEYVGHEALIRQSILELAARLKLTLEGEQIVFQSIGKTSLAHGVAIRAYRNKKADKDLSAQAILSLLL